MRLLVTGGCGFIGSNFIRHWLTRHPQDFIVNLDNLSYSGHLSSTRDFSRHPSYSFVNADICHQAKVNMSMSGVDIVVHFAAESHVDRSIKDPRRFVKTNVLGTQTLLDAAVKHKISRFHHISTDEVFGSLTLSNHSRFSESTPYSPRSPYAASKAASDHLVRAYFHTFGLPVTITNSSNNYGPYQDPEKFLPRMITNLFDDRKIPIYGDGKNVRDWLYVDDHIAAIEKVVLCGRAGQSYCVGSQTDSVSNLEITRKVLRLLGKPDSYIEFVPDRPGHDRKYAVDWSKIKEELGWTPSSNLDQGLAKTVAWYRQHIRWWRPLKRRSESIYRAKH